MPHIDVVSLIKAAGYIGVVAIIFAETGLLIGFFLPGDTLLFTAGYLASQGYLTIWILIPLVFIAAVAGDATGYEFGHKVGRKFFNRPNSIIFKQENLEHAERFFNKHGGISIILARFIPIIRTFVPIVAGVGKMTYRHFAAYNIVGGLIWTVGITLAGYFLGHAFPIDTYLIPIVAGIIVASVAPAAIHIWRENGPQISAALRRQFKR